MGKILVVEDHPLVRDLFRRVLEREGFVVETAGCGDEAMRLFRATEEPFDLLIADQVLPSEVRGHELAWRMTAEDPRLRVLLVSGYAGPEADLESSIWSPRSAFLAKPVASRELVATVRRLLS